MHGFGDRVGMGSGMGSGVYLVAHEDEVGVHGLGDRVGGLVRQEGNEAQELSQQPQHRQTVLQLLTVLRIHLLVARKAHK